MSNLKHSFLQFKIQYSKMAFTSNDNPAE